MADDDRSERWGRIADHLRAQPRSRSRRSDSGEVWIDHRCLFHDDRVASATVQPDTGVYHCRVCRGGGQFTLDEVERQLGLGPGYRPIRTSPTRRSRRTPSGRPDIPPDAVVHDYCWPDGRLSHRKVRIPPDRPGRRKRFEVWGPEWEFGQPADIWPFYGEQYGPVPGAVLVVVEGELKVDCIAVHQLHLRDRPVFALTAGSASSTKKHAAQLALRLEQLEPYTVVLWPDNDEPSFRDFDALAAKLRRTIVDFSILDPASWGLGPKGDVVDLVASGQDLADVLAAYLPAAPAANGSRPQSNVAKLADDVAVLSPRTFLFPGTMTKAPLQREQMAPLYYHRYHRLPMPAEAQELLSLLAIKGSTEPVEAAQRLHCAQNAFWWRPGPGEDCWQVTAADIDRRPNPPDALVLVPPGRSMYPPELDLDGAADDFRLLCMDFGLDELQSAMVEAWCVCVLTGRQAPILLVKGEAGSGKSTLARLIESIIEPGCPEIESSRWERGEAREFVRQLQDTPALLVDNVSKVGPDLEDVMSRLVTGYTASLRTLYADSIERMWVQKGIIITTVTWEPYKSDLTSRMVVLTPSHGAGYLSDATVRRRFGELIPKVRGHIFRRCQAFYRKESIYREAQTAFRIGDMGVVLAALGYEVNELAEAERRHRAAVISPDDPWMEAIRYVWESNNWRGPFSLTTQELCQAMTRQGVEDVPAPSSARLPRWFEEKRMMLMDFGFRVERDRDASKRIFRFYPTVPLQPPAPEVTYENGVLPL